MKTPHARHSTLFVIGTITIFLLTLSLISRSNAVVIATSLPTMTPAHQASFSINSSVFPLTLSAFEFEPVAMQSSGCSSPSFGPATNITVGDLPQFVAVGDFNLDTKPDLVVANYFSNSISVILNNGSGGFLAPTFISVGTNPESLAVGDFNADNRPDIAVANFGSANVSVFLNNPSGGFFPPVNYNTGGQAYFITVSDINVDNKPDLVCGVYVPGLVTVLLNNGSGVFGSPTSFSTGGLTKSAVVGDFNLDGKPDVAAIKESASQVRIYVNTSAIGGAPSFTSLPDINVGTHPNNAIVADVNLDNLPDVLTSNGTGDNVSVLLNTSIVGGATSFAAPVNFSMGDVPFSVAVSDFNLDGKPDMVTANAASSDILVRLGDGAGGFGAVTGFVPSPGGQAYYVTVGDFNTDGRPDLAATNQHSDVISVLLNTCAAPPPVPNTAPTISAVAATRTAGSPLINSTIANVSDAEDAENILSVTVNNSSSATVNGVTVSNITVDAAGVVNADVIAACGATGASFTLKVTDSGGMNSSATLNVTINPNTPPPLTYSNQSVAFNGSLNVPPALASDNGSVTYSIQSVTPPLMTAPTVNSIGIVSIVNAQPTGSHIITVRASDNCGAITDTSFTLDVAGQPATLGNYPNTTVSLSGNAMALPDAVPSNTTGLTVSTSTDFKGILTANASTGVVRITNAHQAGTYTVTVKAHYTGGTVNKNFTLTVAGGAPCADPLAFTNAPNVPIDSFAQAIAIGDFNEDGRQDFVVGYDSFTSASVRFGNGAGGFTGTTTISAEPFIRSIAVGDFNEDGHQDLALSNNSGIRSVSIRLGDGAGNFSGTTNVAVGNIPTSVAIGDFNSDGHQDFATANEIDNTVSVRFGDGAGSFSGTTEISVGTDPQSIVIGDFNGDSKQDFATANSGSASIRLGDGLGGFTSAPDVTHGITFARCIVAGDFNEDGHQDIAISGSSLVANLVSVRLGNGSGGFTGTTDVLVSSGPERMVTGDFNNDGNLDFATANVGFGTLSLRLGDGAGNFTGFTASSEITVGTNPRPLATGDFNGDGKQDFVVAHFNDSNFAAVRLNNSCPPPNNPPTIIAGGPLSRQQGNPAINSQIATVSDVEQAANTLSVTATPLTGSGMTVINITIDASGNVTADVAASCTATNSTFTLKVTDDQNAMATATLTVNVIANTPPALGNYPATTVNAGAGTTVIPDAAPVDNFTITGITASAPGFAGTLSVDPISGVVTVSNAVPVGSYTVTVTATDNCGAASFKTFTLDVICPTYTVNSLADTGAGTGTTGDLRYCITQANAQACSVTINFSVTGVINLTSVLPALNNNIMINGPGAALLDVHRNSSAQFSIFTINSGKTVSTSGLTISNGSAPHGGGIENNGTLTITGSVLTNNIATAGSANDGGGAIFNNGILTITGSSFTDNHADNSVGGAIYNNNGATASITGSALSNNTSCHGGALHHRGSNLTVTSSTLSGNFAGICGGGPGGAVSIFNTTATFTNCTISGNDAQFGSGSGISISLGSITLLNCTVTSNGVNTNTGGIVIQNATLNIKNSIVAGNLGGEIGNNGGTINDQGNNILSGDPKLAPLGNYGGPTQTHALCSNSPAINAGNNTGAPATDQRGVARPVGATADIGAFEANITVNPATIPSGIQFAPYTPQTFTASNGVAPYAFTLIGALPAGITFSGATLSGTPTETGDFLIIIISTDSDGFAGANCYTLTVGCPTITLSPSSLPNGTGGVNYNQILTATGGQSPYTFAVTSGALPPGLTLSSAGVLSGSPTATGTYNFTITATAANGCMGSREYSISINLPPTITASGPLTRERGATATTSQIAVVADAEQASNTLNVMVTPLTGTGVTITDIAIDESGNVTASIAADCAATDSTFTLKVTDNLGVMATAVLTVNVTADAQPPVITCPVNITQSTDTNQCAAIVSFATPTVSDNCPGLGSVVCTPASGSAFPKGVTTVTCTVTDASGNNSSCNFTVTVNDTQAPVISCPSNITQATDANQCSAVVTFSATASDNCPGLEAVSCKPASGSTFAKGVTTVTCTATDASGNQSTPCSFTVTVNDTQAPAIVCPANIVQANDTNQCSAVVNFATPTASDNCPGVGAVICTPAAGSVFPKGTTTVTCTTTDTDGNNGSCNFTVTVNDTQAPTVSCPANITRATDANICSAVVSFSATASDNCSGATVSCVPASGSAFPKGVTTVTCTATDASGNQSTPCLFTVTVNDTQSPSITCPASVVKATDPNQCSAVVSFAAPTVSDNCPGVGAPVCSPPSGSAFPKGITTVNCSVQDASGNQSACSFTVTVNDTQPPSLVCPPNQVAAMVSPTGTTVVVNYPSPVYSDNCPGAGVVCNPPSGAAFPVGLTTVTCTATDTSGNQTVCSFTVSTFNLCLQDDSNPAVVILFNSFTGDYLFCVNGSTWTGTGTVQKQGSIYTLTHNAPGRRVLARYDGTQNKGTASLQSPVGTMTGTISDRDTRNNTCSCSPD